MKEALFIIWGIFATAGYVAYISLWSTVTKENQQHGLDLLSAADSKPGARPKWIIYYWITSVFLFLGLAGSFGDTFHSKVVPHLCLFVLVPVLSFITLGKQMNETPHWP
jgi:hypothetical protein